MDFQSGGRSDCRRRSRGGGGGSRRKNDAGEPVQTDFDRRKHIHAGAGKSGTWLFAAQEKQRKQKERATHGGKRNGGRRKRQGSREVCGFQKVIRIFWR